MGAKRPPNLAENKWSEYLFKQGLDLIHQGKVRDTFRISGNKLLVLATDNISIFNFVLNAEIPYKGECLTALTHFWLTGLLKDYPNHLKQVDDSQMVNAVHDYKKQIPELPIERCLVVRDLSEKMFPFEFIYRHHIGGSIYKDYLANGGKFDIYSLPPNLPKWSKLDSPIFTPTDKSEDDERVSVADFLEKTGDDGAITQTMLEEIYKKAYAYAEKCGVLILDTKFEAAYMYLSDEVLTMDSSRFADKADWEDAVANGREPNFMDKQYVREWGKTVRTPFGVTGLDNLKGSNSKHIEFVHGLKVPNSVIAITTERYLNIFSRLTGLSLEQYQKDAMGIIK
jgi:phosphoribosylaminoimidazole-succinocarboxamide synthase